MFRGRAVVLVLVAAIGGVCGTSIESMSGSITVMVDQGGSLLVQPTGGIPQTVAMAQDVAALSGAVTAVNTSANQVRTYPGPVRSRARDGLRRLGVQHGSSTTHTHPHAHTESLKQTDRQTQTCHVHTPHTPCFLCR
jgi:hypothetical protein